MDHPKTIVSNQNEKKTLVLKGLIELLENCDTHFLQINQLRHDLCMKEELVKFYTQNYENTDSPSTPE